MANFIFSEKYPVEKKITALCIISDKQNMSNQKSIRPTIFCGLTLVCPSDKASSSKSSDNETQMDDSQLYIVVYDFMYTKEQDEPENEIVNLENPTAPPAEDKLNVYAPHIYDSLESSELEMEGFTSYNLMKQLSTYYKTLIPGESDEVFLPPPVTIKKSHTGPRVLHDVYDTTKTDSSTSSYPLTNGPNSSLENSELSISDHIAEVSDQDLSRS